MNREKLQESLINKLNESINWKKDIHQTNYEYHTDENDNYRKFDYPDTIYDFGTFNINGQDFTVTHTIQSHNNPKFEHRYDIKSSHPYDDSEYHWACAYETDNAYRIIYKGKMIETFKVYNVSSDESIEKVAERLLELDNNKNIKPTIYND